MTYSTDESSDLNKVIPIIRKNTDLTGILDVLLDQSISFLGADGGFVFLIDSDNRIIKFTIQGIELNIDFEKYDTHPMEKLPELCEVITTGKDYFLQNSPHENNLGIKDAYQSFFKPPPISILSVPIRSQSDSIDGNPNVIGLLSITSRHKNAFSDKISLLSRIAEESSPTIEKGLLIDQFNKVAEISKILIRDFSYDKLVKKLRDIYEAYGCSIFIKTQKEGRVVYSLKATTGIENYEDDKYVDIYYEEGEGLTGYIIKNKRCLRIYNSANKNELRRKVPDLKRAGPKYYEDSFSESCYTESFLGCCLFFLGEAIGAIRLTRHKPGNFFTSYDEESLNIISGYISSRIKFDEVQLEAQRELNFLVQQIENFAHEANSTYSSLTGYIETLIGWVPHYKLKEEANKNVINEINRLKKLAKLYINKLSTAANYKISKINPKKIKLKQFMNELRDIYYTKLGNISFNINKVPEDLVIIADEIKLQQVFINLINNSLKCMIKYQKGSSIKISAEQYLKNNNKFIKVVFEDDGPGIPGEYRLSIFERGFSLTGGTGLGLSITRSIIEAHNGTIKAISCSQKQFGACFRIDLPQTYVKRR